MAWIQSIADQTVQPDEIIVVDSGSTDGTLELLREQAGKSRLPFRVLSAPGANIARGRNLAIAQAMNPVIAVTDFGAAPARDWLEKITHPFRTDPETCVSAGIYAAVDSRGDRARNSALWAWNDLERIAPASYLPPGGSMAFTKKIWESAGGYPEWLTLTGEDTCFDLELKNQGGKWAFVPEAVVRWHAPDTLKGYLEKMYRWAAGDGEAGIHGRYYWHNLVRLGAWGGFTLAVLGILVAAFLSSFASAGLWAALGVSIYLAALLLIARLARLPAFLLGQRVLGEIAQLAGFIQGARRRGEVDWRRYETLKGVVFILAGVPIDDTGGGARSAQFALEFLRRGFGVVYINRFPRNESRDLNLRFAHPNLFTFPASKFHWEKFAGEHPDFTAGRQIAALVEFPLAEFMPVIEKVRERNGVVVYDLLDAWDTSLGSQWYSRDIEREIIRASQVLVATAAPLQERMERDSGRRVELLPNAVNDRLFYPGYAAPRPADLPEGPWTILYAGALWGEWFDWNLLGRIAAEYPEASVVVIGDYRGQYKSPPANLHFLGLKAQTTLPAYLSRADVAIIPWRMDKITEATSPLKLYEYLAMRLPVVAPDLKPLRQIPGVFLARDADEFVALVGKAPHEKIDREVVAAFVRNNTWQKRVDQLLALIK